MRTEAGDKLRSCPTCGTENTGEAMKGIGLHDYTWFSRQLPGRVGASDIDAVVDQRSSGRVLIHEYKPTGVPLPLGQRLLLRRMVEIGAGLIDVWVVWGDGSGPDSVVEVGEMGPTGEVLFVETMSLEELGRKVNKWWNLGLPLNNSSKKARGSADLAA